MVASVPNSILTAFHKEIYNGLFLHPSSELAASFTELGFA